MRVAFDTSVLVAGSVVGHTHEQRARPWLDAAERGEFEGIVTVHALAELWATLTAIPIEPRIPPERITELVEGLARQLRPKALSVEDYWSAMRRCGERGLRSGTLYDALHLICAEREGADLLLTFNTRHFLPLREEAGTRILAPPDPPGLVRP